jgi:hypothetical protein
MRVFQNSGLYPTYRSQFDKRHGTQQSFVERRNLYLTERYNALHYLLPVLEGDVSAFVTNGDDEILQRAWAAENGLPVKSSQADILLAQIEEHRTEVFYNLDPMRYGSDFVRRLPGSVRHSLAWRAAPSPGADFSAYDRVLNNFPSILESYREAGWAAEYFAPAHDPLMDKFATRTRRPIDILFVGGYTRHHRNRARILEGVAELAKQYKVCYHLERSRMTRLAESPLGVFPRLAKHKRPATIKNISAAPVFGLDLYEAISDAKIVLNGAIDMAGEDRGNMRCFEAIGCGALLVSDAGRYPKGMSSNETMVTYTSLDDLIPKLHELIEQTQAARTLASNGYEMMRQIYSKQEQWRCFQNIVGAI